MKIRVLLLALAGFVSIFPSTMSAQERAKEIILAAKDAKYTKGLAYSPRKDILEDWNGVGGTASWDLAEVPSGNYTVVLEYSVGNDGDGGKFDVICGSQKISESVTSTGGWLEFKTKPSTKIRIAETDLSLSIAATKIAPGKYLMNIRNVILKPEFSLASPLPSAPAALSRELNTILITWTATQKEANQRANASLEALLKKATAAGDSSLVEKIKSALVRMNVPQTAGKQSSPTLQPGTSGDSAEKPASYFGETNAPVQPDAESSK